eukprot:1157700-Pelagomonas_calceolata.AAC.9
MQELDSSITGPSFPLSAVALESILAYVQGHRLDSSSSEHSHWKETSATAATRACYCKGRRTLAEALTFHPGKQPQQIAATLALCCKSSRAVARELT